jgi:hypothetical protein
LEYAEKALSIREKIFGDQHFSVATCWVNLAYILEEQDENDKAIDYAKRANTIFIAEFGEGHGYTVAAQQIIDQIRGKPGFVEKIQAEPQVANVQTPKPTNGTDHLEKSAPVPRSSCCTLF